MNFNHLLEVIDKQLLVGLTIFPETNGTLLIDCTDKEAGISLGNDQTFNVRDVSTQLLFRRSNI